VKTRRSSTLNRTRSQGDPALVLSGLPNLTTCNRFFACAPTAHVFKFLIAPPIRHSMHTLTGDGHWRELQA
jgi:hypothetical protein